MKRLSRPIFGVLFVAGCMVTAGQCLGQSALTVAGYVQFTTKDGVSGYGTVKSFGDEFAVVDLQGKPIRKKGSEFVRSEATGTQKEIQPNWSYVKQKYELFKVTFADGSTVEGGFSGNLSILFVDTTGRHYQRAVSDYKSIQVVAAIPPEAVRKDAPPAPPVTVEKPKDPKGPEPKPITVEKPEVPKEPEPKPAVTEQEPADLSEFRFRILKGTKVEIFMNSSGKGYLHDLNRSSWVRLPPLPDVQVEYTKVSDTLALIYGMRGVSVYDTATGRFSTIDGWAGKKFFSFTRTDTQGYAAQCSNRLALAAGVHWSAVYDAVLQSWVYLTGGADDTTIDLPANLALDDQIARVRVLNDKRYLYVAGTGSWVDSSGEPVSPGGWDRIPPGKDKAKPDLPPGGGDPQKKDEPSAPPGGEDPPPGEQPPVPPGGQDKVPDKTIKPALPPATDKTGGSVGKKKGDETPDDKNCVFVKISIPTGPVMGAYLLFMAEGQILVPYNDVRRSDTNGIVKIKVRDLGEGEAKWKPSGIFRTDLPDREYTLRAWYFDNSGSDLPRVYMSDRSCILPQDLGKSRQLDFKLERFKK